jgi:hypothetical protein
MKGHSMQQKTQTEIIVGKMYDVEADLGEAINTLHQLELDIGNNFYPDICEVFSKDTYNTVTSLVYDLAKIEVYVKRLTQKAEAEHNKVLAD